jgi:oxygen-independent coproporphyrinogen-3 oxidase
VPNPADQAVFSPADCFAAGERNHHISNTAYPISHQTTWMPYKVRRTNYPRLVSDAFRGLHDLCLYAHIPFCEVRCAFCEYTVVGKDQLQDTDAYMDRLHRELALYRDLLDSRQRTLHGFDIGGGTPAFVDSQRIAELVADVRESFLLSPDWGVSIETTPRIAAARPDKLKDYRSCGIDRISMGIQVIQPDLLRLLNRDGNGVEHHHVAVRNIREAGFAKLNLDLMYGFAGQSLESWRATLEHAIALDPEYITLYRMRYKLTRISHQADQVQIDNVTAQARLAGLLLAQAGYEANPGKNTYSRVPGDNGTSAYITRRVVDGMPYLGLGLGAQTFTHRTVAYNDGAVGKDLSPYLRSVDQGELPIQDLYDLPRCHMMAKMVCVSLYFGEVDRRAFAEKFEQSIEAAYPAEVEYLLDNGLMEWTEKALSMTRKGAERFAGVVALFHAPSVKSYLLERDPRTAADMDRHRKLAEKVAERGRRVSGAVR